MSLRAFVVALSGLVVLAIPGFLTVLSGPGRPEVPTGTVAAPALVEVAAPVAATPARSVVSARWVTSMAHRTGIPEAAVRAYAVAQLKSPCGVGWTTLAGIGWVESVHGTIGGRLLDLDGHSSAPILGPALDGRGQVAAIPSTSVSRQWHGDARWDHAVGPMQFLPTTWETWGVDADRDGIADPNDVDDAALAAADYLCAGGYDLSTGSGWSAAILSYNHATSYVRSVHDAAVTYAERTG